MRLTNNRTKVEILCPIHGPFLQTPDRHLRSLGCQKCSSAAKRTSPPPDATSFFDLASRAHSSFYDYSSSTFVSLNHKLTVTCPVHGPFSTLARKHIQEKRGCPECGRERTRRSQQTMFQDFYDLAVDRHGYFYDYSDTAVEYLSDNIEVKCPKHGVFRVTASDHIYGKGCPKCRPQGSTPENELADFIEGLGFEVVRNSRKLIPPLEIDIYLPEVRTAFEFNGIFWHSEQAGKPTGYHQTKTLPAKREGIRLFHVYESEWDLSRDVLKSRLESLLKPRPSLDLSDTYCIHEYDGRYSLVKYDVICSFNVRDGIAVDIWSPYGIDPLKRLLSLCKVKRFKERLDWPEFDATTLLQEGFLKERNVRPERLYFDKKTLRRLKEKPADAGSSYLSVVDSGSTIWVVDDGVVHDTSQ